MEATVMAVTVMVAEDTVVADMVVAAADTAVADTAVADMAVETGRYLDAIRLTLKSRSLNLCLKSSNKSERSAQQLHNFYMYHILQVLYSMTLYHLFS
jgi:hypothetical protein